MRCPYCTEADTRVVDSRPAEAGAAIRRRRACPGCGERFSTFERAERLPLRIRKRGGVAEPFDRAKLELGMARATANLPVPDGAVRDAAERVEAAVRATGGREVPSELVGTEVLAALADLHPVAYVRFASVYKGFTSLEDLREELATLEKAAPPKRAPA